MEQKHRENIRRYFCSGNNKQGQSRGALTYRKILDFLQIEMLTKHFANSIESSIVGQALLTSYTTKRFDEHHFRSSLLGRSGIGAH
jgi:hypothetical protein